MTLNCIITVQGRVTRGDNRGPAAHGNTVRPKHDMTREVRKFFRAYSCYSNEVAKHVLSCKKCTPDQVVDLLATETVAWTMRPGQLLKKLYRQDPRGNKAAIVQAIGKVEGVRALPWIVKYAPERLWEAIRGIAECRFYSWNGEPKAWGLVKTDDGIGFDVEALGPGVSTRVRDAELIHVTGGTLPETWEEASKMVEAARVHSA